MHWDDDHPQTLHNIRVVLQRTKEVAMKREKALADAFSHQVRPYFFVFFFLFGNSHKPRHFVHVDMEKERQ